MRTVSAVLAGIGLWLSFTGFAVSQGEAWKPLTSQEGRFSLLMPGAPKEQSQEVATPAGTIKMTMYVLEQGESAWFATFNDYPAEVIQKADAETLLNGARDGAIGTVQGKLLAEKKIAIDTYPGRELEFEAQGGAFLARSRIYLVKERLYQIMILSPKAQGLPKDTGKFLDSFKLTK